MKKILTYVVCCIVVEMLGFAAYLNAGAWILNR